MCVSFTSYFPQDHKRQTSVFYFLLTAGGTSQGPYQNILHPPFVMKRKQVIDRSSPVSMVIKITSKMFPNPKVHLTMRSCLSTYRISFSAKFRNLKDLFGSVTPSTFLLYVKAVGLFQDVT